jgi:hypothetical protein
VPGVPNGGGFTRGLQGDGVPAGPKAGFDPDGFGRPNGGRAATAAGACAAARALVATLS